MNMIPLIYMYSYRKLGSIFVTLPFYHVGTRLLNSGGYLHGIGLPFHNLIALFMIPPCRVCMIERSIMSSYTKGWTPSHSLLQAMRSLAAHQKRTSKRQILISLL